MADRVNAATEKILPIFKSLQSSEIQFLSSAESQKLLSQITNFEYKIARNARTVQNYLDYLTFYKNFINLLNVKRKLNNNFANYKEIEGILISKCFNILEQACHHFPHENQFLDLGINLCKEWNSPSRARRIFEKYLELHGHQAEIYLRAARFFYDMETSDNRGTGVNQSFDEKRMKAEQQNGQNERFFSGSLLTDTKNYLQLGARKFGGEVVGIPLWCEWIRFELIQAIKIRCRISELLTVEKPEEDNDDETIKNLPKTDQEILEKARYHGFEPNELALMNGKAVEIVFNTALSKFIYPAEKSFFLFKVSQILEEFHSNSLNFNILTEILSSCYNELSSDLCQISSYSWYAFMIKEYKKSNNFLKIYKIFSAGLEFLEEQNKKEEKDQLIVFGLSLFEEIYSLSNNARSKRQVGKKVGEFIENCLESKEVENEVTKMAKRCQSVLEAS